jgi:xanthine/uracil permease
MTFTYREKALKAGRNYTVTDVPPLGTSILLGVQHYLTMLGATVSSVLFFLFGFAAFEERGMI